MLRIALTSLLKAIIPALTISTSLFNGGVYDTWYAVLVIAYALSSIFLIAVAYSYLSGRALGNFRGTTESLTKLSMALVLMPFTLYICQIVLDINDAMTSAIVPYSQIASYTSMIVVSLGGYSFFTLLILSVVVALLYIVLVVRVLLVFFIASLMPLICLCFSLNWTRAFAEKMISLLVEMAFLPFFVSVALRIGISASYSTIHSLQVVPLIIAGTYLLPLIVPFVISPGGSRLLQYVGLPPVSAVIAGAATLGAGTASHLTGRMAPPLKSALGIQQKTSATSRITGHEGRARITSSKIGAGVGRRGSESYVSVHTRPASWKFSEMKNVLTGHSSRNKFRGGAVNGVRSRITHARPHKIYYQEEKKVE
jgi:hypothetical protein